MSLSASTPRMQRRWISPKVEFPTDDRNNLRRGNNQRRDQDQQVQEQIEDRTGAQPTRKLLRLQYGRTQVIPQLVLIALATLISEDLTCIATGVLVAQGKLSFAEGTAACIAGIFVGDALLFLTGRVIGRRALRWRLLARFLPPDRIERAAAWLQKRGLMVIFLSRFTPGLRLPTYFAAGLLPTKLSTFMTYFLVASAIWTPLVIGATGIFGEELLEGLFAHRRQSLAAFVTVFGILAIALRLLWPLVSFSGRRRLIGFLKRKIRWEFWPPWAAYLPLAPYFLYLALRHRSLTLFTAANPGIPSGGFVGESKSQILCHLSRLEDVVAEYAVIPSRLESARRIQTARRFMSSNGLEFPVVLKPDVGERGSGVAVIRSFAELESYLHRAESDTIIQRYVEGAEFGVFYYRYPNESRGRIFSITEKRFPVVVGDGKATLRELILRDSRAICMAATYQRVSKRPLEDVPAAGESVQLVELGSHCRGAVFLDGWRLKTPALEEAIDRISRAHPGFFFGRFDIRTASVEAFRQGQLFSVIELNGVSAEPTHIYDPSVSLLAAYRVMFEQWKIAFEIGAANRDRGAQPMHFSAFVSLLVDRMSRKRATGLAKALSSHRGIIPARAGMDQT